MSPGKKIAFTVLTLLLVLGSMEGAGRLIWAVLAYRAFTATVARGEAALRNDGINFMKAPDGRYGYVLKPGFARGAIVVNAQGFAQRESVTEARRSGVLRVLTLGESTTQGHDVDTGNYPVYLGRLLKVHGTGFEDVEIINAGVAGWVSDQIALRSEHELAGYRPDIVVLYAGWNDFQVYDPFGSPPRASYFAEAYGSGEWIPTSRLRSVELARAAVAAAQRRVPRPARRAAVPGGVPVAETYRFYVDSLDRVARAYRRANVDVQIVICTLVGRWPHGSLAEYVDGVNGRVHWMRSYDLTPDQAAEAMERFNEVIRMYAAERGLVLIDAASALAPLDRGRLQWDFAHMHAEGYELLAEIIYRGLRDGNLVAGVESPRLDELMTKYRLSDG